MKLFKKDKHILVWLEELLKNDTIREAVERHHVYSTRKNILGRSITELCIFFGEEHVKSYPGVNSVIIAFGLTWRRKIRSVESITLCDMWEDKFGHGNVTPVLLYQEGYDTLNGTTIIDIDYATKLILPYLQDANWKRNNKFGL